MRSFKLFIFPLIILTIQFNAINSFSFDYMINDFTFYPIPNVSRPPKGVPYIDKVYRTEIVRITDAPTDVPGITSKLYYAQPGYPKHDIENADGTKLIIQSYRQPLFHIWNANPPYNKIRDFPSIIADAIDPDPRWDATDPNVLYFTYATKFYKWNVTTNELKILHDFNDDFSAAYPNFTYVSTREEGTPSNDSRYWAFLGYIKDASGVCCVLSHEIVYDKDAFGKDNGKVFASLDNKSPLFFPGANNLSMSPSGKWVMDMNSVTIWPRDFSSRRNLGGAESHGDFAYDETGREVYVNGYQRYSPDGYSNWGRWVRMVDLETGEVFWPTLAPGGGHVSGNSYDKPGWALFSMAVPFYPTPMANWYDHAIYMVELKRRKDTTPTDYTRIWRLATANNVRKGYSDDSYAKINTKGTKVWFGSAWGQSASDAGAQYDVYQINLPSTWYQDLKGSNSLIIMTRSLPEVFIGSSYSQTLQIIGGTSPYTWSITSGTLPSGLSLNSSTGVISGTPTTLGTFTFTVQVRDATPQTNAVSLSIKIRSSDTTPPAAPRGVKIIK